MVAVKLKMRTIYKAFLGLIGFLLLTITCIAFLYFFYDKITSSDSDVEVAGNLSINYISGKNILVEDSLTMNFSVTNGGDDINYYNVSFSKIRGNGNYKLYYKDILINEGDLKTIDEISTDYISIDINETKDYKLEIINTGDVNLKATLNVIPHESLSSTFADLILENNSISTNTLSEIGLEPAKENEGLIKSADDIGVSYFFRGNVNNNYVSFGDLLWRIVRINGDGTVRLVLDDVTDTISNYYPSNNLIRKYDESNINTYLKEWLQTNLSSVNDYIANSRFCSDIVYNDDFTYQAYDRIITNNIPTLNCLGENITSNIGLLTIDEIILAGASKTSFNRDYYLYNSNIKDSWYTMTSAKGDDKSMNMFMIDSSGNILMSLNGNLYRNVRPVINLIKNIEMTGKGTIDDPYKVKNN